jgi:NADPH:quinone reductase
VDERIVGRKPISLSFDEAAAMPLTAITAWEALYDRLALYSDTRSNTALPGTSTSDNRNRNKRHNPSSILIIGGAGGVGSIAIQLAKNLVNHSRSLSDSSPGINVIATAS